MRRIGLLAMAGLGLALALGAPGPVRAARAQSAADQVQSRVAELRPRRGGVLGIMGYNVTPDGSANAIEVDRGRAGGVGSGSPTFLLGQTGFGFTVSESVPLFLETYWGYARYDPRAVFTEEGARRLPLRWNNVAWTVGAGYDIRLAQNLYLRPIVNLSIGYAAPDAALFGFLVDHATGRDIAVLTNAHMNVWGLGGSLMVAYYDYRPQRDIDVELRYTQIRLQTFGDTPLAARGSSTAQTIGLWGRYRWPTGWEAFGRPIRWVIDGSVTTYFGDQRAALGFSWAAKLGGGIEFDVGRYEIGALGLNLSRVRLVARYFHADRNITGASLGVGMSF